MRALESDTRGQLLEIINKVHKFAANWGHQKEHPKQSLDWRIGYARACNDVRDLIEELDKQRKLSR